LPGEETHRAVLVGTREFIEESGLETPDILEVARRKWEGEGARVLVGGWDGFVRAVLKLSRGPPGGPGPRPGEHPLVL
jgi:hypothetical protein